MTDHTPEKAPSDLLEIKFYEAPEGVCLTKGDMTVYANVNVARDCDNLVAFRIVKQLASGKRFTMVFELDAEFSHLFADRVKQIADSIEKTA